MPALELRTHESLESVGRDVWSALLPEGAPPFLSYDWLDSLEKTGCVRPERGWLPMHLTLYDQGELLGAAPAYVKGNSEGEFVFDHSFASFAQSKLRLDYYPKLIVAIPFTPATSARLLLAQGADPHAVSSGFVAGLAQLSERIEMSGAHVLFPAPAQAELLGELGMARRFGIQYHWHNDGYRDFDDFLSRFNAKRRAQIRRERRQLAASGVRLEALTGSQIDERVADIAFELYRTTVEKFYWGRQYLNRNFFREVCRRMPESLHIVLARDGERVLAGAFNQLGKHALYGRYWGAFEERPFLHFDVCYYFGVEECIRRGLALFEPGAGGEHKHVRGFVPSITHSAHYFADPRLDGAVRDFLARERLAVSEHVAECAERPLLRPSAG